MPLCRGSASLLRELRATSTSSALATIFLSLCRCSIMTSSACKSPSDSTLLSLPFLASKGCSERRFSHHLSLGFHLPLCCCCCLTSHVYCRLFILTSPSFGLGTHSLSAILCRLPTGADSSSSESQSPPLILNPSSLNPGQDMARFFRSERLSVIYPETLSISYLPEDLFTLAFPEFVSR